MACYIGVGTGGEGHRGHVPPPKFSVCSLPTICPVHVLQIHTVPRPNQKVFPTPLCYNYSVWVLMDLTSGNVPLLSPLGQANLIYCFTLTPASWLRAPQPTNTSPDWKLPIVSDRKPLQTAERFLCPFVLNRREMVQSVPTKGFVQPTKTATMCCYPEGDTHPPSSPLHLFWKRRETGDTALGIEDEQPKRTLLTHLSVTLSLIHWR